MTDEPTPQTSLDQAAEAPTRTFLGKTLHPFSFSRQAVWQRCQYDRCQSELESLSALIFICTLGDEIVENGLTGWDIIDSARDRAGYQGIKLFRRRTEKWCDENNIGGNTPNGEEATCIGYEIWNETINTKATPVIDKPSGSPNV